ncbi:MAG TPA: DUF2185 domain-containing protein [Chthoniobacterales bacterium]|jgi:hypothetical protein|nr:DUF2185 domain-containing protein [Chthoniobacterales bacterium]
MSYEKLKRSAAILCKHISYPDRPILRATRELPVEPEDSGWQFLCGVERHDDASSEAVWALEEVAALDTTLRSLLDSEPRMSFERSTVDTPWRRVSYGDDE